jgi:hypothetical protein
MKDYVVLYIIHGYNSHDIPFAFVCEAEDLQHVRDQVLDHYELAEIVWIHQGTDVDQAIDSYWDHEYGVAE